MVVQQILHQVCGLLFRHVLRVTVGALQECRIRMTQQGCRHLFAGALLQQIGCVEMPQGVQVVILRSIMLFSVIVIYAVGGCILSGIFSVGETKSLETLSAKIHGYGSVIGFLLLTLAPLFVGLYFFKVSNGLLGILSLICFIFAIVFFALFVMADKPNYRGTIIAFEGLWQRLSLLSMYLPIAALCIFQK